MAEDKGDPVRRGRLALCEVDPDREGQGMRRGGSGRPPTNGLTPALVVSLGRHDEEAEGLHRIGVELVEDLGEPQTAGAVPEGPGREEHRALAGRKAPGIGFTELRRLCRRAIVGPQTFEANGREQGTAGPSELLVIAKHC
jgi:hypothetical protein